MFVLQELDKILEDLSKLLYRKRDASKIRLSLPDIERVKVDRIQLVSKVPYSYETNFHLALPDFRFTTSSYEKLLILRETLLGEKYQTTDSLLFTLMASSLLSKLAVAPEYHYPCAKLIICDSISYDLLCRLKRISISRDISNEFGVKINLRNFLHKNPFNITAVMLMQNIVDMFDSTNQPIIVKTRQLLSREVVANFNYPLLRKVFPYVKMSDLFIVVDNRENTYNLNYFSMKTATRERTILQLFSRYARSTKIIDMSYLINLIGKPHQILRNVLMFDTTFAPRNSNGSSKAMTTTSNRILFNKIDLASMTYLAERLLQVSRRLRLRLKSISYRKEVHADVGTGQTKIFSQFIASSLSSTTSKQTGDSLRGARVLVLDRSGHIQSVFQHADRYGPFLEQECGRARGEMPPLESLHKLDEIVYLDKLTGVLGTILGYSQSLKSSQLLLEETKPKTPQDEVNNSRVEKHSLAMTTSSSIKKHLESIKAIYRRLNEGYLMILRLETTLEVIDSRLRNSKLEPKADEDTLTMEQLQKVRDGMRQLIKTSGGSIVPSDIFRLALLMIDVSNRLNSRYSREQQKSGPFLKFITETKQTILGDADFKKAVKSAPTEFGVDLALHEAIEPFVANKQTSDEMFATIHLDEEHHRLESDVIIVMFLGSMTVHEVAQVKMLEKTTNTPSIMLFNCGITEPEVFLNSL